MRIAKSRNVCKDMFFVLSKVLYYFVMPFTIISALFLFSAFVKKSTLKKKSFIIGLVLMLFFSNEFIVNEMILLWEVPVTPMKEVTKTYAWGIILTGVTKHEVGPSDRIYFQSGADRVTHTLQLYRMGKVRKILVSGGSGNILDPQRKEAEEIAEALRLMGVPNEDIGTESESRNTHESAVAVKKILQGKTTPAECILITSAYHMRRSSACFKKAGWPADCFSVDFISHRRTFTPDVFLIPKAGSLITWQTLIKEWTGMIAYKVAGYI